MQGGPRLYRKRVIFTLPESGIIERARECAREYIVRLGQEGEMMALCALDEAVQDAYSVLLIPEVPDETSRVLRAVRLREDLNDRDWADSAAGTLIDEDALLPVFWDPAALEEHLDRYYFQKGTFEVTLARVWDDLCRHCYMTRPQNKTVLRRGALLGVEMGLFGCAAGKDDEEYRDLVICSAPTFSPRSLLVSKQRAEEYCRQEAWREKRKKTLP